MLEMPQSHPMNDNTTCGLPPGMQNIAKYQNYKRPGIEVKLI